VSRHTVEQAQEQAMIVATATASFSVKASLPLRPQARSRLIGTALELLGDPRRVATEDPDAEDADGDVDDDRGEEAEHAARGIGG
jgi:hypothetical protein